MGDTTVVGQFCINAPSLRFAVSSVQLTNSSIQILSWKQKTGALWVSFDLLPHIPNILQAEVASVSHVAWQSYHSNRCLLGQQNLFLTACVAIITLWLVCNFPLLSSSLIQLLHNFHFRMHKTTMGRSINNLEQESNQII